MKHQGIKKTFILFTLTLGLWTSSTYARAETREFNLFTVEVGGVKMWLPSVLVVHKGDRVNINATVKIPGPNPIHGFTIQDFKVVEVADDKGKKISFVADKAGIFPIRCHLHAAHVGGQLIVLDNQ